MQNNRNRKNPKAQAVSESGRIQAGQRKVRLRQAMVLLLAAAMLSSAVLPLCAYAAAGPIGDKVNSGYDEETWARLQDNVLEYDEIPDLVHEYNSTVTDIWEDLEETRQDLIRNTEEIKSQKRKMKDLKEETEDEIKLVSSEDSSSSHLSGLTGQLINYTIQEAILEAVAGSLNSTAYQSLLNRTTLASLKKVENQFTQACQQLMIAYDSLNKQKNTLTLLEALYGEQYRIAADQQALGLATDQDVLTARANQLSAQSTIASIDAGLLQLKPTICTMAGWPADGDPELAPIPATDLSRIDNMNLEEDTRKAIGNNSTLIEQRTSEQGKTYAGIEARLGVIHEGDQRVTIEMKRLYDDVLSQKTAYEAAWDGYQSALKSRDKYQRMYELGLLSRTDYLGTEISYYQKKAAWETADTSLLLALETYDWAVLGLGDVPQ